MIDSGCEVLVIGAIDGSAIAESLETAKKAATSSAGPVSTPKVSVSKPSFDIPSQRPPYRLQPR